MLKILPYKLGSASAKLIAQQLGCKRIIPKGNYRPKHNTLVLNWGNSSPRFSGRFLNKPEAVRTAINKLTALTRLRDNGIPTPEFTTDRSVVMQWQTEGYRAVARHKLCASGGLGIQIVMPEDEIPYAPLYTKYTKKDEEYRVHVFCGEVIDYAAKRKRRGYEDRNSLIRTHANGWVFCRDGVQLPESVRQLSIHAVAALGLDFAALDVIVRKDKAYVLEANTAPGIEGTTLQRYVAAIRRHTRQQEVVEWVPSVRWL